MLEKVMEKIALVEVMRDVAENIARLKDSYQSSRDSAEESYNSCDEEKNYWKQSYLHDMEEYDRKLKAIEKISEVLVKLI